MKILYFVKGNPTEAQKELAKKVGAKIRNALAYRDGDFIENCDSVMGDYPTAYSVREASEHHAEAQRITNPVKRGRPRKESVEKDEPAE